MTATAAIAVVSWNTRELLERCLRSLRADAQAGRAEVWVVDNGSSDGSAEAARAFGWVHVEETGVNLGFGAAVNRVAERTQTEWIVPANADVALAPGALRALIAAGERHPEAGALAPRLLLPDGRTQHTLHPFPSVRLGLALSLGIARGGLIEGRWDPDRPREADWAHGALLLVRRAAWDEIGGFDAAQWLYAEDLDLGWRLRRAGWRTRYVPEARVEHAVSAATAARWNELDRAVRTQRSAYAWMLARQGRLRTRATAVAHLAGPLARARLARDPAERARQGAWAAMHRTGLDSAAALEAHRQRPG